MLSLWARPRVVTFRGLCCNIEVKHCQRFFQLLSYYKDYDSLIGLFSDLNVLWVCDWWIGVGHDEVNVIGKPADSENHHHHYHHLHNLKKRSIIITVHVYMVDIHKTSEYGMYAAKTKFNLKYHMIKKPKHNNNLMNLSLEALWILSKSVSQIWTRLN